MVLIDKEKGVLTQLTEFLTDSNYEVQAVAKPVAMSDILRVHEYRYIKNVIKKCQELDYLQQSHEELVIGKYDRDSFMSSDTWKAALLSCGSIIEAVDKVMSNQFRNAFCAVRPPGHHAGVFGKTFKNNECDQEQTNGFCYINNAAVAAAYLKNTYRN